MWRQPKAVWAVAFASVVAFMGIGLVDPILKPIADNLKRVPIAGVAVVHQLHGGDGAWPCSSPVWWPAGSAPNARCCSAWVIIIAGAGLAGMSDTVAEIVGWRALWGLGNALFIATALATIVSSARGSVAQAIILYEAALGLGIAVGPLVGGVLGSISWRGPFFGVSALMAFRASSSPRSCCRPHPRARARHHAGPTRSARCAHRGLLGVAITALLYNFGFFTLLAFHSFPARHERPSDRADLLRLGGWRWHSPLWSSRPGCSTASATVPTLLVNLLAMTTTLAVMAVGTNNRAVLATCVVVAGLFIGINNTLITETVMKARAGRTRSGLGGVQLRAVLRGRAGAMAGRRARRADQRALAVLGRGCRGAVRRRCALRHPEASSRYRRRGVRAG